MINYYFPPLGFLIGIFLGSLVKALADRSLTKKTFLGRSSCPNCKHQLAIFDLIPLFSYLFLKGKCRYCHKKIGIEYFLVEVGVGTLIGLLFFREFASFQFPLANFQLNAESLLLPNTYNSVIFLANLIFKIFFMTVLLIVALTDIKKMIIPDRVILPSLKIGLIYLVILTIYKVAYLYYYLSQTLLGRHLLPPHNDFFYRHALMAAEPLIWGAVAALLLGGFFLTLVMVTKGRGMGGGDIKLGAFMGVGLGLPNSLLALMLGFLLGAVYAICLIILGKKRFGQSIAFGPFLVLGSLVTLFWGNQILEWYLHLTI